MSEIIASIVSDSDDNDLAWELSGFLGAPFLRNGSTNNSKCIIRITGKRASIELANKPNMKPLQLDFNKARVTKGRDPLLRAVGNKTARVIDITAGWCTDAIHMARHGVSVVAFEKNKIVYALASHAIRNIEDQVLKNRISLTWGDACEMSHHNEIDAEVVYLDPMYPPAAHSAAVKKPMAFLREIVESGVNNRSLEDEALLEKAMTMASKRVVVKRPHYAPPIASGKVGDIMGKRVRFDIYKPIC